MSSSTSPADSDGKFDINEISTASPPLTHHQTGQSTHIDYAYPMAQLQPTETRLPAFGGEFQPGLYHPVKDRKIANPAPLGLCAFALSTFVLGLIEMEVRGVTEPNILIGLAFAYGGLVQLLSGMWYVRFLPLHSMHTDGGQGDGSRKHIRCYSSLLVWRVLDLRGYYFHSRRI